jgi:hypothetical protein
MAGEDGNGAGLPGTDGSELPADVVREAERLTRLAHDAVDPAETAAYEDDRDGVLADHGFTARVREADETLVLHPEEWVEDGTVRTDRIEDTDRAVEVSLRGAGDDDTWEAVEERNAALVAEVAAAHGEVHAANARAFADFMGNHYARRVGAASRRHVREFLDEYYPRNAFPSAAERAAVEESLAHLFDVADADVDVPGYR